MRQRARGRPFLAESGRANSSARSSCGRKTNSIHSITATAAATTPKIVGDSLIILLIPRHARRDGHGATPIVRRLQIIGLIWIKGCLRHVGSTRPMPEAG
jgi:hypothetical protein